MGVQDEKHGFSGEDCMTGMPDAMLSYPGSSDVDADCDGTIPECMFRNPQWIAPQLPCRQRCLFGSEQTGAQGWYRRLMELVRESQGPVYLLGGRGGAQAKASFARGNVGLRDDFVLHVLECEPGVEPEEAMSRSARRDARIGDRAGLTLQVSKDTQAMAAFYALYQKTCERIGIQPLPADFVAGEFQRCPSGFELLLALRDDQPVAGRLLLRQGNSLRIIEGSALREHGDAQPDAWLTREVLRYGCERGVEYFEYGITEVSNEGLRAFKRRMGFQERSGVLQLSFDVTALSGRPVAHPPRPEFLPGRVDLALLEQCNFACGFCYREPWVPELSEKETLRKIHEIAELKHSGIAFSGGEPTLRKELVPFIRAAKDAGIEDIQLHTNGWRAAERTYARELAEAGLLSSMVSLHSHRAETFAEITRTRSEYFERTLLAIDNLRLEGIYVMLSHVINALNYEDFPAYVEFVARRLPGAEIFLFFVYPSVKGEGHPHLYPRLEKVRPHWVEGLRRAQQLGVRVEVDSLAGLPLCFMTGFESLSRWDNALEQENETDGEVDDHQIKAPEMRQAAQCGECRHSERCPGFWSEYLDVHGDGELIPVAR